MKKSELAALRTYLESLRKGELVELLVRVAERRPVAAADVLHHRDLSGGDVELLVKGVSSQIASASEPSIQTASWNEDNEGPDYSRVKSGLEELLERGCGEAVVDLGQELLEAAQDQMERSHDEGEIAMEVTACFEVVARGLVACPWADADKIMTAYEWILADDYELTAGLERLTDARWSRETWSDVADQLAVLIDVGARGAAGERQRERRQDPLVEWRIGALEAAGRGSEVDRVREAEAIERGAYLEWVRRLREGKRLDEAVAWAERGVAALQATDSGAADRLRAELLDIASKRRKWPMVAAYLAEGFFECPSVEGLQGLVDAAERVDAGEQVRRAAIAYLETGTLPTGSKRWPLPASGLPSRAPLFDREGRFWGVRRDVAIAEGRPREVLRWHDRIRAGARGTWSVSRGEELRVAEAVRGSHPERAIQVYRAAADACIEGKNPKLYPRAGAHLERARELLVAAGREPEWAALLAEVREVHRRKVRLMEVLDGLEARTGRAAGGSRGRRGRSR